MRRGRLPLLAGLLAASAVAPAASAAPAPRTVALPFNQDCIAPDAVVLVDGDCDGNGTVFTDGADMPAAGKLVVSGVPFAFPAHGSGVKNTLAATGQRVPLPGQRTDRFLHLLAFAVNGSFSGKVTLFYADGTKSTETVRAADWTVAAQSVLSIHKHSPTIPVSQDVSPDIGHAYLVTVPLAKGKVVTAMTLPTGTVASFTQVTPQVTGSGPLLNLFAATLSATSPTPTGPVFN